MSNKHNFTIKQGKTFERRIQYQLNGEWFDLTDYEARMQIRPQYNSATVYCSLSSSIGIDGTGLNLTPVSGSVVLPRSSGSIGITISAHSSSQFTWKEAFFDLEIYSGSGVTQYVREILRGNIQVLPEVTK